MLREVVVAAVALVSAPAARAVEPTRLLPEELAIVRSIVVQDRDELETSLAARHLDFRDERRSAVALELEYGITDHLQAIAEVPYGFRKAADAPAVDGVGDVEVGLRYAVLDWRTRPLALDVGVTLELPTGSWRKGLGEGSVAVEPNFTLSRWLGPVNRSSASPGSGPGSAGRRTSRTSSRTRSPSSGRGGAGSWSSRAPARPPGARRPTTSSRSWSGSRANTLSFSARCRSA